jgi:hypothetical protein
MDQLLLDVGDDELIDHILASRASSMGSRASSMAEGTAWPRL